MEDNEGNSEEAPRLRKRICLGNQVELGLMEVKKGASYLFRMFGNALHHMIRIREFALLCFS
jgi:hypothetical protein